MREFEELTEAEKWLRTLIYAAETRDIDDSFPSQGNMYLDLKIREAKDFCQLERIALVQITKGRETDPNGE